MSADTDCRGSALGWRWRRLSHVRSLQAQHLCTHTLESRANLWDLAWRRPALTLWQPKSMLILYVHINLMRDKSIFMGQQPRHALTHCRLHGFYFEWYFKILSPLFFAFPFWILFSFSLMRCHNAICCFECSICQENKYAFFMHIANLFTPFINGGSIQKLDFYIFWGKQCLHYSQC